MRFFFILFFSFSLLFSDISLIQKANDLFKKGKYIEAFKIYKRLKTPLAINNIAIMYYFGYGVFPNQGKAVLMLESLLKDKNLTIKERRVVLYNLANMYYNGFVNENLKLIVDRKKAKKLFLESKLLGYKPAIDFYNKVYKDNNETK
jgi:TPR repeat protein